MSDAMTTTKQDSARETTLVQTGIRLPLHLSIAVKKLAAERRTSVQQIAKEALTAYLSEADKAA